MSKKQSKKYDLCVIGGAGHVGLPFGVSAARSGVKVVLFDTNKEAIETVTKGRFPFKERGGDEALRKVLKSGKLFATSDSPSVISESDMVLLVIGTPVDKYLNPNLKEIYSVVEKYKQYFRDGQTLILRSTVFPGTSQKIQNYFETQKIDVRVAFCPERVVEGEALEETRNVPQIISAFDKKTLARVGRFFKLLTAKPTIVVQPMEAELSKLFSNAWRYLKFAIANQFYMIATDKGLDYRHIHEAMTRDYSRNKDIPKPGFAAGPCLFKDTMQLAAFNNNTFFIGHAAMLVNEGLPQFVLDHVKYRLCEENLHEKTVGILGMTFKAESDDPRDSLSFKLRKLAETEAKGVFCHDPFLKGERSFVTVEKLIKESNIIILATPHKVYQRIDPAKYKDKIFIDIWQFWKK